MQQIQLVWVNTALIKGNIATLPSWTCKSNYKLLHNNNITLDSELSYFHLIRFIYFRSASQWYDMDIYYLAYMPFKINALYSSPCSSFFLDSIALFKDFKIKFASFFDKLMFMKLVFLQTSKFKLRTERNTWKNIDVDMSHIFYE